MLIFAHKYNNNDTNVRDKYINKIPKNGYNSVFFI